MHIEIRDANSFAANNISNALHEAGLAHLAHIAFLGDEVHLDVPGVRSQWQATRQLLNALTWYGLHPHTITD